jgi:hypothetical protein
MEQRGGVSKNVFGSEQEAVLFRSTVPAPVDAETLRQEGEQLAAQAPTPTGRVHIQELYEHTQQHVDALTASTQAHLGSSTQEAGQQNMFSQAIQDMATDGIAYIQDVARQTSKNISKGR